MDLVASYSSDESENESKTQELSCTVSKNAEFNSEVSDSNIFLKLNQSVEDKCSKDYVTNRNIFDCRYKNGKQDWFENASSSQNQPSNFTESEKIDYLHLESSDTDDEHQIYEPTVDDLLSSAAILKDIECGPEKLVDNIHQTSCTAYIPVRKRQDDSFNICPTKYPKFSLADSYALKTDESCNVDKLCPKDFIYRSDDRIHNSNNQSCRILKKIFKDFVAHQSVINALDWCVSQHSHLLLSASADCTVKVWDIFCKNPVESFNGKAGWKAAKWMKEGTRIVAGGYEKKALVFDVVNGTEIRQYHADHYISSLEVHPSEKDLFLCGTKNAILLFDLRVDSAEPMKIYASECQEILDIVFLNEREFACSTNIVSRDSADRTIMVWDFLSGAILSKQVYRERYTCPSLKVHPNENFFAAQTNGDYIAYFSTQRPYKIQNRRSVGHKVSGYGIECDISPDGNYIVSGDANGDLYFYLFRNGELRQKLTGEKSVVATNRVRWHPVSCSTVAASTWDGGIQIWQ